uniref:ATP-grasp fold amidoligase family protein n=1 Tax=Acetatifactor sp. TaxID=1872090 RepID=UPI0040574F52
MVKLSIFEVLNRVGEAKKKVVIVGAGILGKYVLAHLRKNGIEPWAYFDNKLEAGSLVEEIEVVKPKNLGEDYMYIIAVKNEDNIHALYEQLQSDGVCEENIIVQEYYPQTYDFRSKLQENEYQKVIDMDYYERFLKLMDWESPCTYNEKINWEKAYVRDRRKTQLADKVLVREWIEDKIGGLYLNDIYGVWDNPEDIDFSQLPEQFVLKMNNGSVRNIIVTDKSKLDKNEICKQINEWKNINFGHLYLEEQYRGIKPKILCEKYLEGLADSFYDYDVYCFHGEPKYIWCINGSHKADCKAAFYDLSWNKQPFSYGYPLDEENAPRPKNLDKIVQLSRILAADFEHVRIDWYEYPDSEEGFLFSEMTFSTWGGGKKFIPEEYDSIFGKMI